jgi:hypothetical protein
MEHGENAGDLRSLGAASQRRSGAVAPELIGRIAPTRIEGLNMRGIFSFPIEQYAEALLPSWVTAKIHGFGR